MSGNHLCVFEGVLRSREAGFRRSQSVFPSRRLLDLPIIAHAERLCPFPTPKGSKATVLQSKSMRFPTLCIPLLDAPFKYFLKSTVELLEILAERLFTFNTPKKPSASM